MDYQNGSNGIWMKSVACDMYTWYLFASLETFEWIFFEVVKEAPNESKMLKRMINMVLITSTLSSNDMKAATALKMTKLDHLRGKQCWLFWIVEMCDFGNLTRFMVATQITLTQKTAGRTLIVHFYCLTYWKCKQCESN